MGESLGRWPFVLALVDAWRAVDQEVDRCVVRQVEAYHAWVADQVGHWVLDAVDS